MLINWPLSFILPSYGLNNNRVFVFRQSILTIETVKRLIYLKIRPDN